MELIIDNKAAEWFKEEVGIPDGAGIRFKMKIYGSSPVSQSFALAIDPSFPLNPISEFHADNGIHFFIEKDDEWFFQGHDLIVSLNEEANEPIYTYRKDGEDKR